MRKKKLVRNVGVMFSEKVYQRLVQVTNEAEIPMSEYIRSLVEDEIKETEEMKNE
jgi:predicted DNA-binding protein